MHKSDARSQVVPGPSGDDNSDGIYLTTQPKNLLSLNTAFNFGVWGVTGGVIGSYLPVPGFLGGSLATEGALGGVVIYGALLVKNMSFKLWDNLFGKDSFLGQAWRTWETGLGLGGDKDKNTKEEDTNFYNKYGLT